MGRQAELVLRHIRNRKQAPQYRIQGVNPSPESLPMQQDRNHPNNTTTKENFEATEKVVVNNKPMTQCPHCGKTVEAEKLSSHMLSRSRQMNNVKTLAPFLIGLLLASSLATNAAVDEESIFWPARHPASELDLLLSKISTKLWQHYVTAPDEKTREKHPLITQTGVGISLRHSAYRDRIDATAWVSNLDGFLKLSPAQRKQLVLNTLELVKSHLLLLQIVDKNTGRLTGRPLENRHIELSVIISDIHDNDKNESIRLLLPSESGVGQAGYENGRFVFSETYFLNLKVHDGVAVSGDPNKFIIEHE